MHIENGLLVFTTATQKRSSIIVQGKLKLGKQMRQCYLPGAWLDNEDESPDQRAIS